MSHDMVRHAAYEVLTGRETAHSLRILKNAQASWEQVRTRDPQTYRLVKRAMIEKIKRQIRRVA